MTILPWVQDPRIALNAVLFQGAPAPYRNDSGFVVFEGRARVPFGTGNKRISGASKHLVTNVYTAWWQGRCMGIGAKFACGNATTQVRDAGPVPDEQLCDACVLADLGPCVYRFFDHDGHLAYVGYSKQPHIRLAQHRWSSPWFCRVGSMQTEYFATQADGLAAEAKAIADEAPRYNRRPGLRAVA